MSASSHSWTMHLTSKPDWVGACYTILEEDVSMLAWASIWGRVWNQTELRPPVCDVLERLARIEDPQRGAARDQSSGVASGHPPFVARHLERTSTKHQVRLDKKKSRCWVGTSRPLCVCSRQLLAESRPSAAVNFAEIHDRAVWQCLANILRTDLSECSGAVLPPLCRLHLVGSVSGRPRVSVVLLIGPVGWIAPP